MAAIESLLQRLLREPSPDVLWQLHPHLLTLEGPDAEPARALARSFYCYLSTVQSKLTSKQYSSLSAMLAAGSVASIAVQDVREALACDRENLLGNMLAGVLAATLETLATFQHVKAWETEFASAHEGAVWDLYAALWMLSVETQPDLPVAQRQALIDHLLAVVRAPDLHSSVRIVVIVLLFETLLLIRLLPSLSEPAPD